MVLEKQVVGGRIKANQAKGFRRGRPSNGAGVLTEPRGASIV